MRSKCAPHIASESTETFARRVYAPVAMAGVAVLSLLITSVVMRLVLSLLFIHMVLPHWALVIPSLLGTGGVWGIVALPFLYVVLGGFYGYAQKKEIDLTDRPVARITALARALYGVVYRVTLYIVSAVGGSTCSATSSSQARQIHLFALATTQRESHARPPRLRLGRPGTAKEAGHVRLSSCASTVAIATAGGTRA